MPKSKEKIEEWEKDFDDIEGISDSVKMFFKPRIRRWIKLERLRVLKEVEQIMMDTLSVDNPESHQEVDEMYRKLWKIK